jgi:acyl carrier protein
MNREEIELRLGGVFSDVFRREVTLSATTTAADIAGWDSLTHIRLMLSIQQSFGIRVTAAEASGIASVGDLIALLERKLK